eukprot:GHVS01069401.1.p1 GENE.GHVS01069401.1~~GHVS01069401.1.p1  ORF type:complete len:160 (-),score=8.68 GHVS01069401.1:103-582(-)
MSTFLFAKQGKPSSSPTVSEEFLISVDGVSQTPQNSRLTTPLVIEAIPSITKSGYGGRTEPKMGLASQPTISANAEKGFRGRNGNLSSDSSHPQHTPCIYFLLTFSYANTPRPRGVTKRNARLLDTIKYPRRHKTVRTTPHTTRHILFCLTCIHPLVLF